MRKKGISHVVTRYSMPIPGMWNFTLRCQGCKREHTEDNEKLPSKGVVSRNCKCQEKK